MNAYRRVLRTRRHGHAAALVAVLAFAGAVAVAGRAETLPPTVTVAWPPAGTTIAPTSYVSAGGSWGIAHPGGTVEFLADGEHAADAQPTIYGAIAQVTLAPGTHQLAARATNLDGETTTSAPRTVHVAFPTPDTTGYAHTGVTLHPLQPSPCVTYDAQYGDWKIICPAQIDSARIGADVYVRADNVTISRSLVHGDIHLGDFSHQGHRGLVLTDVEITSQNPADPIDTGVSLEYGQGATLTRVLIHGTRRGMEVGDNTTVTDSYIADNYNPGDGSQRHTSAITSFGTTHVTLRGNVIESGAELSTASLALEADFGPNSYFTVTANRFNGGAFCVYPATVDGPDNHHVVFTGNRFGVRYERDCGVYGPVLGWVDTAGSSWSNNRWDAPGEARDGTLVVP